jgi:hypothetical protein
LAQSAAFIFRIEEGFVVKLEEKITFALRMVLADFSELLILSVASHSRKSLNIVAC